jgi:hypothetical protein
MDAPYNDRRAQKRYILAFMLYNTVLDYLDSINMCTIEFIVSKSLTRCIIKSASLKLLLDGLPLALSYLQYSVLLNQNLLALNLAMTSLLGLRIKRTPYLLSTIQHSNNRIN